MNFDTQSNKDDRFSFIAWTRGSPVLLDQRFGQMGLCSRTGHRSRETHDQYQRGGTIQPRSCAHKRRVVGSVLPVLQFVPLSNAHAQSMSTRSGRAIKEKCPLLVLLIAQSYLGARAGASSSSSSPLSHTIHSASSSSSHSSGLCAFGAWCTSTS